MICLPLRLTIYPIRRTQSTYRNYCGIDEALSQQEKWRKDKKVFKKKSFEVES
jgi:hypothetical protein